MHWAAESARQILHGKDGAVCLQGVTDQVHLGLGEDGLLGILEKLRVEIFHVVAVDDPQTREGLHAQQIGKLAKQGSGLVGQLRLLFHINSVYHQLCSLYALSARWPMSRRQKAFWKWI